MKTTTLLAWLVASGDSQNFLGAPWVRRAVDAAPPRLKRRVALWALSLSPHYFDATKNREAEAARLRASREQLARDVVAPHVDPGMDVLDLGCGSGDLAAAVGRVARQVFALDISPGALACARTLNGADNIRYFTPDAFTALGQRVDLAYSFALAQHLSDAQLRQTLHALASWLRPGGQLLMHVVIDAPGWRSEAEWRADRSVAGRLRLRYGLHCFSRSADSVRALFDAAHFQHVRIEPMSRTSRVSDDIGAQHLVIATAPS